MAESTNSDTNKILEKYGKQIEERSTAISPGSTGAASAYGDEISREFSQFKNDMMPEFSRFERLCQNIGGMLKLNLAAKDRDKMQAHIDAGHLNVTPSQVVSLAFLSFFIVFIGGLLLTVSLFLLSSKGDFSFLLVFLSVLAALFLGFYFYSMPARLANQWRLKAGSQMVPCILYTVIYMKHTSNLERAIAFASQHLEPPLALDLRKVFWDVETGRYSTLKESLDRYLETWRGTNSEFIESFNLIESSLFEPSEARRLIILERALQVMLDGVYDKMLKYTHEVKSPLTNIYMLGIVLPTLGLALIPLASVLMGGILKWYHVFILFDILVPFIVFYLTNQVMIKRPGGYGESSILELNPMYPKYKSKKPYIKAALLAVPLFILGILPFIFFYTPIPGWLNLKADYSFGEIGLSMFGDLKLFDFIVTDKGVAGPMGLMALLCSLLIPLAIIVLFAVAYKGKTKDIIKSRDNSKILENEFNNSLFQLGNRLGDGMPAEIAFGRVAESSKGLVTENFFRTVNSNIQSLGMSVEKAIFDSRRGAILLYPSNLISTSMHVLIESVKKGLQVAAQSLMSISDYVKNVNKINDRLRDLLADVISDMRSNMTFLAPLLAGVVVGLASMITLILGKLGGAIGNISLGGSTNSLLTSFRQVFSIDNVISPYMLQLCVGIYIIEIIFILTKTLVTVDAGEDKLKVTYETGRNLMSGGLLYLITAFIATVVLSAIASVALPTSF